MKKWVLDILICPECLNRENRLDLADIALETDGDILEGALACPSCGTGYDIRDGIGILLPKKSRSVLSETSGYNSDVMLSSYLWSHFSGFFNGAKATDAYEKWASFFTDTSGYALDIGCSVGRLSFEMTKTHGRVIGMDTSLPFISKAREILKKKKLSGELILEGHITEPVSHPLDAAWNFDQVDFIVADALALPFSRDCFATAASVNVLEKVPNPALHLEEVNRVLAPLDSLFVFSDPFSWDAAVSPPETWLGGRNHGPYKGRGMDNMKKLFSGKNGLFDPPLAVREEGRVDWKIRKTENLWEHITSQFLVGARA